MIKHKIFKVFSLLYCIIFGCALRQLWVNVTLSNIMLTIMSLVPSFTPLLFVGGMEEQSRIMYE